MDHLWILLALSAALTGGTGDALTKKVLQSHAASAVAWSRQLGVAVFLLPFLFILPIPPLDAVFFQAFLSALPFELVAYFCYIRAIQRSPLSLTVPFLAFTPIVLIGLPYLILGESVSLPGGIGILLIGLGSYCLNLSDVRKGFWAPFRAIGREKGSLLMIVTAVLFGFTNTFSKQAIAHSSAFFFGATYNLAFFVILSPFLLRRRKSGSAIRLDTLRASLMPGFLAAATVTFATLAMSLMNVAYTVALCRLSLLVGVLYGRFLFHEAGFRQRLFGTALMLAGLAMIVLCQEG